MKEINEQLKLQPDTELVAEQEKHYKYIGSIGIKPGHQLFSVHMDTVEVKLVEIKRVKDVGLKGNIINRTQTLLDPKLFYCSALNKKNALKKFRKTFNRKLK
jgi:hypothetical protein